MNELVPEIRAYLEERGWDELRPSDLAKSISIEAAELLEVFQWDSLSIEETKADKTRMEELRTELADVLIYCLEMATLLDIDVEKSVRAKLEQVKQKYPVDLVQRWKTEPHGGSEAYRALKKLHREGT